MNLGGYHRVLLGPSESTTISLYRMALPTYVDIERDKLWDVRSAPVDIQKGGAKSSKLR